jgi:hypothetical protein
MDKIFQRETNDRNLEVIRCLAVSEKGNLFSGKAICAPNDDFSLEKGEQIAEKRAKIKQLNKIADGLFEKSKAIESWIERNEKRAFKIQQKIWKLENELENLTGIKTDE